MELLIVLGLCFGAYELLGVFQGCFHNEPPLPYQPPLHHKRSSISGSQGDETKGEEEEETENENDEQLNKGDNVDSDEYLSERKIDKENKSKSASEARNNIRRRAEDEVGDLKNKIRREIEEEESGPCSCYSTTSEFDEYDDDTKSILRSKLLRKSLAGRKNHPISKFSLSSSLMSLNRDDLALFNYIDNITSGNKFSKFKSQVEISETSFNKISSNNLNNERRRKKSLSDFSAVNSTDSITATAGETYNNELNSERNNPTVDSGRKKIFFISAAS